jgi:hypothetical protein
MPRRVYYVGVVRRPINPGICTQAVLYFPFALVDSIFAIAGSAVRNSEHNLEITLFFML